MVLHEPSHERETEHPELVSRNTRTGLLLFAVYLVFYAGFMGLSTFSPEIMKARPFGGMNLAILYGFGLIVMAFALAIVYLVLCRRPVSGEPAAGPSPGGKA
jgi:uncharacterized membrane protein (DUF485 family)